jgi:hypothetical protein
MGMLCAHRAKGSPFTKKKKEGIGLPYLFHPMHIAIVPVNLLHHQSASLDLNPQNDECRDHRIRP